MNLNCCSPVAPSTLAASYSSFGIDSRPAIMIIVQNGRLFHTCTSIAIDSASQRSLSQFGPSSPVSLKITWLMTPHSGFSMKRIDRIVGIDGTAHGRMNSTESHLIHGLAVTKNPDNSSAAIILRLIATTRKTSVLTTDSANTGSLTSWT